MKKFIVAHLSFFDNVIVFSEVQALSKEAAIALVLGVLGFNADDLTEEELKDVAFNGDVAIDAFQVTP